MSTPEAVAVDATILTDLRAALAILEHAERLALPIPWDVDVSGDEINFAFDSLAELAQWAQHMEVSVIEDTAGAYRHYNADGHLSDRKVHCWVAEEIES
jgi:hypothetical protein